MIPSFDDYFALRDQIFSYFGYVEDWKSIPLSDHRGEYWFVIGEGPGCYCHSPYPFSWERIYTGSEICGGIIYTQRFLPKWVYRGPEYTMVCADTESDDNKVLMIFENAKECTDKSLMDLYEKRWR